MNYIFLDVYELFWNIGNSSDGLVLNKGSVNKGEQARKLIPFLATKLKISIFLNPI